VVSTDSVKIAKIAQKYGAEIPFIRPKELSTDKALTYDVVEHCITFFERQDKFFDIILLLQPTVPFRKLEHIDRSIEILKKNQSFNSVVSVVDVDGNHPLRMKIIQNGYLKNYINQDGENMIPRASLPEVFIRSGSIYCIRIKNFKYEKALVSKDCAPLKLKFEETINIDNYLDFDLCQFLLEKQT
jgi:N-acylneuraminate cytidylyltransferase/CMP-N,N'-diacetyllegionaminic acid synthase